MLILCKFISLSLSQMVRIRIRNLEWFHHQILTHIGIQNENPRVTCVITIIINSINLINLINSKSNSSCVLLNDYCTIYWMQKLQQCVWWAGKMEKKLINTSIDFTQWTSLIERLTNGIQQTNCMLLANGKDFVWHVPWTQIPSSGQLLSCRQSDIHWSFIQDPSSEHPELSRHPITHVERSPQINRWPQSRSDWHCLISSNGWHETDETRMASRRMNSTMSIRIVHN